MRNRVVLFALLLPVASACSDDPSSDSSTPTVTASISTPATTPAVGDTTLAPTVAATVVATTVVDTTVIDTTVATTVVDTTVVAGSTAATEVAVAIADFKFDPQTVNVPVGGSVIWTNNDAPQHTATAAGNFDTGAIDAQASMSVTFEAAGSFTYICSFHPFMTGTVVVG